MAWNRSTVKVEDEKKSAKKYHAWHGLVAGLIVVAAAGAAVLGVSSKEGAVGEEVAAAEEKEELAKPKQSTTIREVKPAAAPVYNVVAEKLQSCKFLVNQEFKKKAKFYLCIFSASWCPPCRAEMPRIAKTYVEKLKADPDIELIHFSWDQNDEKAMSWAKEHGVKFPVVAPDGGNPLNLDPNGIPHLYIFKDDGTLLEDGHPMKLFTEEKIREFRVSAASASTQSLRPRPILGGLRRPGQPANNVQQKGVSEVAAKFGGGGYVPGLQQGVFEKFAQQFSRDFNAILKCGKTCADADRYSHAFGTIMADVDVISHEVQNEQMGTVEKFNENDAVLYEGEIYLEGGKEYAFFVAVDDWASIEIDGERILSGGYRECCRGDRWKKGSRLIASKTVEKSEWHPIRVWMCDICGGGVPMLGFGGMGIGWNAEGCKELNAATFSKWHPLRDDGSGRFLRSKPMPQKAVPRCGGLLGGSLRARRLQRQQAAQQVVQKKETVDGYTWSYRVNNDEATIVAENRGRFSCAVSPSPKGSLTIPLTLGGAKVTGIGREAFKGCSGLLSVTIPDSVKSIGGHAFWGCSHLSSQTLPQDLRHIGDSAFRLCVNLTSVTIPSGVESIESGSFRDCSRLTMMVIPPSVDYIGSRAFEGCSALETITILPNIKVIKERAFYECTSLNLVKVCVGDRERVKGLYSWAGDVQFVEIGLPVIESDEGATVTGDAEAGFVIKPSERNTAVEVTIPQGVDAAK